MSFNKNESRRGVLIRNFQNLNEPFRKMPGHNLVINAYKACDLVKSSFIKIIIIIKFK